MANLDVVFLTGLTTGGLSCLAVQGGLLASSIAYQAEQDVQQASTQKERDNDLPARPPARQRLTVPIALFLAAKLVAYTLLGLLLGWLGSMLQLTPITRGMLQIAIGILWWAQPCGCSMSIPYFASLLCNPRHF
ncbi:MAG: hypothetical protein HC866_10575 [Leptolyngbyaceae cyanobacterium RU_5_1]|nr:hypothetical protein [Leptolyngbyaceae cyanobacterium RU_5_1]